MRVEAPKFETENTNRPLRLKKSVSPRKSFIVLAVAAVVSLGFFLSKESGYLSLSPGPSLGVEVDGVPPDSGYEPSRWRLLTVEVSPLSWAELIGNSFSKRLPVVDARYSAPGSSGQSAQMLSSERVAAAVAFSLVNPSMKVKPEGATVRWIQEGSSAEKAGLRVGDVIRSIDGAAVDRAASLRVPSGVYTLEVTREGEPLSVEVEVVGGTGLGVNVVSNFTSLDPPALPKSPEGVGGASGGLIYTLALVDALEIGDLSGGLRVAATGSIETDGTVGKVSGVPQKLEAARDWGADVVFVPIGSGVLTGVVNGLEIVPVRSAQEAISYLCEHGGSGSVCGFYTTPRSENEKSN